MSKKRKGSTTTKNTKKNVYKTKSEYQPMLNKMKSISKTYSDEDFAVLQTKVLTESNERTFEHIIEMLQSGMFSSELNEIRNTLSNEYPILKEKIMEREIFLCTLYLQTSIIKNDTKVINEWGECFKRNPMEVFMKTLRFVEWVRSDSDMSNSLKKLDKLVDWKS